MQSALLEASSQLTDREFRLIAELVETEAGIKLPRAKRLMLEGRLHKRVRALNCFNLEEYVERLFDDKNFETELVHLIDVVTTNKTDFFREPHQFGFGNHRTIPVADAAKCAETAEVHCGGYRELSRGKRLG